MCGYVCADVNRVGVVPPRQAQRAQNCTQLKRDHPSLSWLISVTLWIELPFFTHSCVLDLMCGIKGFMWMKEHKYIHVEMPQVQNNTVTMTTHKQYSTVLTVLNSSPVSWLLPDFLWISSCWARTMVVAMLCRSEWNQATIIVKRNVRIWPCFWVPHVKPSNPSSRERHGERKQNHTIAGFWIVNLTCMHSLSVCLTHTHTHTHTCMHTHTIILLHSLVTHHHIISYLDPCKRRWLACLSSHCRGSASSLVRSNLNTHTHTHTHMYMHMYMHIPWRTTVTKSCNSCKMQRIQSYSQFSLVRLE